MARSLPLEGLPEGTMTQLKSLITPAALLAAFTFAAAPSFAQDHHHGRENPSGQALGARSAERAQPRSETSRPQGGAAPRVESRQETPRAQQARPVETPRAQQPRQVETPRVDNRAFENRRNDNRSAEVGRAVPRREVIVPRGGTYAPHYSPSY